MKLLKPTNIQIEYEPIPFEDLQKFALLRTDGSHKSQEERLVLLQAVCFCLCDPSENLSLDQFFSQFKWRHFQRLVQYREKGDFRWKWCLSRDESIQLIQIISKSIDSNE